MERYTSIERTIEQTEKNRIRKIKQSPLKGIILLTAAPDFDTGTPKIGKISSERSICLLV